jgi:hypothetical protein
VLAVRGEVRLVDPQDAQRFSSRRRRGSREEEAHPEAVAGILDGEPVRMDHRRESRRRRSRVFQGVVSDGGSVPRVRRGFRHPLRPTRPWAGGNSHSVRVRHHSDRTIQRLGRSRRQEAPFCCLALHVGSPHSSGGVERDAHCRILAPLDGRSFPACTARGSSGRLLARSTQPQDVLSPMRCVPSQRRRHAHPRPFVSAA